MRIHYKSDLGKTYSFFPYRAYISTPGDDQVRAIDPISLIPSSIRNLIFFDVQFECPIKGITSRYLEVFDTNSNTYIIECPLPWFEISFTLFSELDNDSRLKGWVAHGEKIKYRNLLYF